MEIDLELAVPEAAIDVLFGARALAFALRQYMVTQAAHCLVWSDRAV